MILAGVCLRNHTGEVGGEGAVGGQLTETAGLERAAACSSVDGLILARRHVCRPRYLLLNDYHIYIYIFTMLSVSNNFMRPPLACRKVNAPWGGGSCRHDIVGP